MEIHEVGGNLAYAFAGGVLVLFLRWVWDKVNKNYVTEDKFVNIMKEHLNGCEARRLVTAGDIEKGRLADMTRVNKDVTGVSSDITIIKKILFELAKKADVDPSQYRDLIK